MAWEMYRKHEEPHRCRPSESLASGDVGEGDIIKCECGNLWQCYMTDGGMQWDPSPRVLAFKRYYERTNPLEQYGR